LNLLAGKPMGLPPFEVHLSFSPQHAVAVPWRITWGETRTEGGLGGNIVMCDRPKP